MPLQLIDRFHPQLSRKQQATIDAGGLRKCAELELLEPQQLRPVALLSLALFGAGIFLFGALNIAAYLWRTHAHLGSIGGWTLIVWILLNFVAYFVVLPLHEAVHGLAFAFWGGKPYYGAKLPYALYCGAKNQVFRRNHYLIVGLAPLVVLSLLGIVFTLAAPGLASYAFLGIVGNFSGAAGDVIAARSILKQPPDVLVEDTDAGFRVWELQSSADV